MRIFAMILNDSMGAIKMESSLDYLAYASITSLLYCAGEMTIVFD